jgi:hypothetical protein
MVEVGWGMVRITLRSSHAHSSSDLSFTCLLALHLQRLCIWQRLCILTSGTEEDERKEGIEYHVVVVDRRGEGKKKRILYTYVLVRLLMCPLVLFIASEAETSDAKYSILHKEPLASAVRDYPPTRSPFKKCWA